MSLMVLLFKLYFLPPSLVRGREIEFTPQVKFYETNELEAMVCFMLKLLGRRKNDRKEEW